ncbi:MAG: hypothetical protein PHH11_01065 [Methylomonas sp.]|nr:hypothetical protein [Methylomonas sp.]
MNAFEKAGDLIAAREAEEGLDASAPQIDVGRNIFVGKMIFLGSIHVEIFYGKFRKYLDAPAGRRLAESGLAGFVPVCRPDKTVRFLYIAG